MTNPQAKEEVGWKIARYSQPCFTHNGWNKDGEPFKITELPLIKADDGKYVLYDDIKQLIPAEKMLTAEEIQKVIALVNRHPELFPCGTLEEKQSYAIHQSSIQKAGL